MTAPLDPRIEAAAKAAYEGARSTDTAWEDIPPEAQDAWRQTVMPVVAAADAALVSMTSRPIRGNRPQRPS